MSALRLISATKTCKTCKKEKLPSRIKGASSLQDLEMMVAYLKQGD